MLWGLIMAQQSIDFDTVPVVNSTVTNAVERRRLSGHHAKIVDRLKRGPASNRELCESVA